MTTLREAKATISTFSNMDDKFLRIFDSDDAGSVEIRGVSATPFRLEDRTISRVPGTESQYSDDLGNQYRLNSGRLLITLISGDVIQIDAFASGDLDIVLGPDDTFDIPTVQPGSRTFAVDFVTRPTPPETHGLYASGAAIWSSYGAVVDDTVPEIVTAASLAGGEWSQVLGGPGDSIITGDSGFNNLVDDAVSNSALLGVIYGNDVLRGGDGLDWLTGSFGDDWLYGGDDDSADLLIDNPDSEWGRSRGSALTQHLRSDGGRGYLRGKRSTL